MNISDLKNIVVLKNLPSNIVEEAIVVLKPNKKIHKYQIINARKDNESSKEKYEPNNKESSQKNCKAKIENNKEDNTYIVKEAEMLVKSYIENLEKKRPNNRKIEQRLRKSIIVNIILSIITVLAIILSLL